MNVKIICRISLVIMALILSKNVKGQYGTYWGGGVNFGAGNNSLNLGIKPEIVHAFSRFFDLGGALNVDYLSTLSNDNVNPQYKKFSLGIGLISRFWIADNFVVSCIPEYNWIQFTAQNPQSSLTTTVTNQTPSILLGLGYGTHESDGIVYFVSIFYDVLNNPTSPYYSPTGQLPFIRAGIGFYFKH
ncbi:MAG: hypothetical protein ORN85_08025 [Sediminibacterium sp.]|nr:hypothetical protein [Sediminibacterium sp.]